MAYTITPTNGNVRRNMARFQGVFIPGAEYAGAATDIGDAGAVRQAESDFLLLVLRALWAMAAWI